MTDSDTESGEISEEERDAKKYLPDSHGLGSSDGVATTSYSEEEEEAASTSERKP